MFKWLWQNVLFVRILTSLILHLYLRFVYLTTKIQYELPRELTWEKIKNKKRTIWVCWHNQLAILPIFFRKLPNNYALASPHRDGEIIGFILKLFGVGVIWGSTNSNSYSALRDILSHIQNREANIGITPDGPRGPKGEINSNLAKIAAYADAELIPVSSALSKYIRFNSWDKFIFPLPFGRAIIKVGSPINVDKSANTQQINKQLKITLKQLRFEARNKLGITQDDT